MLLSLFARFLGLGLLCYGVVVGVAFATFYFDAKAGPLFPLLVLMEHQDFAALTYCPQSTGTSYSLWWPYLNR